MSEQDEQPPVTEAPALVGQLTQPAAQRRLGGPPRPVADHLAIGADDRTGPPLRQAHRGLQMRDCLALGDGPYHFFDKQLAQRRGFQHLVGEQLLQLRVLLLERLQPLGVGDVHAAVLGLPVV